jgi:hypothetical protein
MVEGDAVPSSGQPLGAADAAPDWVAQLEPQLVEVVKHNGWKSPADAVRNYAALVSYMGADKAGRGVVLPKSDEDLLSWPGWEKLGTPARPEDYGIATRPGVDPVLASWFEGIAHQLRLPKVVAERLVAAWEGQAKELAQQEQSAALARREKERDQLLQEWGFRRLERQELASRGAHVAGLTDEQIAAMELAIGVKPVMEMLARIGGLVSEAKGVPHNALSPRVESVEALQADPVFMERYRAGDPDAVRRMNAAMLAEVRAGR